ncbi:Fe2+-dependent dioxygenase [Luteibacter aegosomaticola]|jgi:PKHD-type hydroxylase|uniref:Fe2+-dependent dioxygenase n=1 Tax=Luteibacter aegosomaticola TaxID=2911538 RepID=UPI001FFB138A|nr:Fe2+-dependent dioxygenase [Luteibacter aegosomaticola]UPG91315.1 Fe2+-dependent dioxygenase [Luteibacter aegosomaticola]
MLLHIPDVLTSDEVAGMRKQMDGAEWTDGRETVGPQGARVKRNLQLPQSSPLRKALGDHVVAALNRHPLYHAAVLPLRTLSPRFNRYEGGGEYGFHIDGAVMQVDGEAHVRSDISCTLFLADPEEYDGGELIISDLYGEHEVKLAAGDAVVYPSSSLHRVTPVTRGARIASFFWVQSLVRDDSARRLLLEMDTAIRKLTADGADQASILQLTGVYHNLLRRWAET